MQSANDLVAGTASGVTCALVEHPLDTVKTRMQACKGSYRDCVSVLLHTDGPLGFYRGLPARLGASGLEYGLTFGGYKGVLRLVGADERRPTPWQILAGGVGGGLATTAALTPFELVKCRMQVHCGAARGNSFTYAIDLVRAGGGRALYHGSGAMLLREVYGTTVWCGTNDLLRERLALADEDRLSASRTIVAGGLSGIVYAALVYPTDVIKTCVQASPRFNGMGVAGTARTLLQERGVVKGFYRGFGIVAVCAFPSSAAVFLSYELCRDFLEGEESSLRAHTHQRCADSQLPLREWRQ